MTDPEMQQRLPTGRISVLFGAGASVDAGLKVTSQLAEEVVRRANALTGPRWAGGPSDWVRLLNAVYAGMVGHGGGRGEDPLTAVNIETLISAVRLLQERDAYEVAPFVGSWAASLSEFGSTDLPEEAGEAIVGAVGAMLEQHSTIAGPRITAAVAQIARAALKPDLRHPLKEAEIFIMSALVDLLGTLDDVSYLAPLVDLARTQEGGLDLITLNYDLAVETVAQQFGGTVNRGIATWTPGEPLEFDAIDGVINLMKLHGSLDWLPTPPRDQRHGHLQPHSVEEVPLGEDRGTGELPWIVVGDREKLATDGPTLALNAAARVALARTSHLVIVGYSFRDRHINAMVRDWLAADDDRTITMLEPEWPRVGGYRDDLDFRAELIATHGRTTDHRGRTRRARVNLVEGSAASHLRTALHTRPSAAPDPLVEINVTRADGAIRLDIAWFGEDLVDVTVAAWESSGEERRRTWSSEVPVSADPVAANHSNAPFHVQFRSSEARRGDRLTAYVSEDTHGAIELQINGASAVGGQGWYGVIDLPGHSDDEPDS